MHRFLLAIFILITVFSPASAQLGGFNTYKFLNLSPSARVSALGGNLITVRDDDVNLAYANPALLNNSMHQALTFNHNFYLSDINAGYAAYGHHVDKWGVTFHGGVQYISYGKFDMTNELGDVEGDFKAAEYAVTLGGGYQINERLAAGANLKFVTSQLEGYNSTGLAFDLAGVYFDTAANFIATIVMRNAGAQLVTYYEDGAREPLPFEVQLGISKRLRYLPFRFSIIYRYFDRWDILYDDPDRREPTFFLGDAQTERSAASLWFDNFFRHFVFNGEFLLGKKDNFRLRVGYSHLMRKELSVDQFRSLAGFTFGAGIKVNRFRIDYGRGNFHLAGGMNHLSISTNIREFK
jgi:hypothetical protein